MEGTVALLLVWIAAHTGLTAPPPVVQVVSDADMVARAYGPEAPECPAPTVRALYDPVRGVICLRQDFDPADVIDRSTLLHELVHHVQKHNRLDEDAECPAVLEPPAYRLQFEWLKEQGVADPMKATKVDALTLYLAGTCHWE